MTKFMNAILERVLSEELGRQSVWLEDDKKNGFDISSRVLAIDEIKNFMKENDIKFRDDYYFSGSSRA